MSCGHSTEDHALIIKWLSLKHRGLAVMSEQERQITEIIEQEAKHEGQAQVRGGDH